MQEWLQESCDVGKRYVLCINLVQFLKEDVAYLEGDTFAHLVFIIEYRKQLSIKPVQYCLFVVLVLLQELEDLMKLETDKHEIFINSVVVNLVPMKIEDVNERFEPFLLFFNIMFLTN